MSQAGIVSLGNIPPPPGSVTNLQGNVGPVVPPNAAGVINVIGSGNVVTTGNAGTNTLSISVNYNIAFGYVSVNHAASPYTVVPTDYFISCDPTLGTITILLPNAPTQYTEFVIKDRTGQAAINNIIVTTVGGLVLIDASATFTMNSNFQAIQLLFNGVSYEVY